MKAPWKERACTPLEAAQPPAASQRPLFLRHKPSVFLDTVLDQWFATVVPRHCRGYCTILRYVDDTMALFERDDDIHRVLRVVPLRLWKCCLRLRTQKTHLLAFGKQGVWPDWRRPLYSIRKAYRRAA